MNQPTTEQQAVIEAATDGEDLVVQAGAGTGKTSTLQMVSAQLPKSTLYVAYNKAIATEAASRFPSHVTCRTSHSLAFREVGREYAHRITAARQPSWKVAEVMKVKWLNLTADLSVSPNHQARIAADTVRRFCYSSDEDLADAHVPYQNGINGKHHKSLTSAILPLARRYWTDVQDTGGTLPFEHDHYLKMWALSGPRLAADVIFLDEAQDSNPVLAALIAAQSHAQQIVVGDSCQPTGTLVTVVETPGKGTRWVGGQATTTKQIPIEQLKVGDIVVSYNVAHRYMHRNGSPISGISSRYFAGTLIRVEDRAGRISSYTPDHHCVVRFGEDIADKFVVYVMQKDDNYRVGVTGGRLFSQSKRLGLVQRALAENADAMWLVSVHSTRAEAMAAEAMAAWLYSVPDVMFRAAGHGMGAEGVEQFWEKLGGNSCQAAALLTAHGRDINFPIWKRGERLQTRRAFVTQACNLIDGMEVLPLTPETISDGHAISRQSWVPIIVSAELYHGLVWSMTVEGDHTYVGDGIVTHNCQQMYAWRGAVDALKGWGDATQLYLSQSWRFGQQIADEANKWLAQLPTPLQLTGNPAITSELTTLPTPAAILCRTNAGAMGAVLEHLDRDEAVAMVGGGQTLARLASAAADLLAGKRTSHPELYAFPDWAAVSAYAQETAGRDLLPLVNLIDTHGPERIIEATRALVNEDQAATVVSTTHKAKGREWDSVRAAPDFFAPHRDGDWLPDISAGEAMVGYVAVTRARHQLDREGLAWIDDYCNGSS